MVQGDFGTFDVPSVPRPSRSRRAGILALMTLSAAAVITMVVVSQQSVGPVEELESLPALQARLAQLESQLQYASGEQALSLSEAADRLELRIRAQIAKEDLSEPQVMGQRGGFLAQQQQPTAYVVPVEEIDPYNGEREIIYAPVQPRVAREMVAPRARFVGNGFGQGLAEVASGAAAAAAASASGSASSANSAASSGAAAAASSGSAAVASSGSAAAASSGSAAAASGSSGSAAGGSGSASGSASGAAGSASGVERPDAGLMTNQEYNQLVAAAQSQKTLYEMADGQANVLDQRGQSLMREGAELILGGYQKKQEGSKLITEAFGQRKAASVARLAYEKDVAEINAKRAKSIADFDAKYADRFAVEAQKAVQSAAVNLAQAQIAAADASGAASAAASGSGAASASGSASAAGGSSGAAGAAAASASGSGSAAAAAGGAAAAVAASGSAATRSSA